jgi:signal transduction histidine kinase
MALTTKSQAKRVLAVRSKSSRKVSETREVQRLVAELSAAFVRVIVDGIDDEINRWLKRIVLTLGVDRSTVVEIDAERRRATFSHGWAREESQIVRLPEDANTRLPWFLTRMLAGETFIISSLDQLPLEAAIDRESMREFNLKSNVMIPIKVDGAVVAAVGFGTLYQERQWSSKIVKQLEMVAEIFGYAFERKLRSGQMERLRSELNYVSRVTTMGELSASLAHELNQPLAAIQQNAETIDSMLAKDNPDLTEVRAAVSDIIEDNQRAGEIIRRLRAFFRRGDLKRTPVELGSALRGVARIVQSDAVLRNVSFVLDISTPASIVMADRVQLQQAIVNLVLNAFDAVAGNDSGSRKVVLKIPEVQKGWVRIQIEDSGPGIKPELAPQIFDAFFTTRPNGMGMGLAISRSIVEANGGRLTMAANSDRGATFEIALPTVVAAAL